MATKRKNDRSIPVHFAGLGADESPPDIALYELDAAGRATKRLGQVKEGTLELQAGWEKVREVALGPAVEEPQTLSRESLVVYRPDTIGPVWQERGLTLGRALWGRLLTTTICVDGRIRKCRPWWWTHIRAVEASTNIELARAIPGLQLAESIALHPLLPLRCTPLCDGIVEVYERVCCCRHFHIPDLLDRLRDILDIIPIPLPDPWPDPIGPIIRERLPLPDPGPLANRERAVSAADFAQLAKRSPLQPVQRVRAADLRGRVAQAPAPGEAVPPERLYEDYVALTRLAPEAAQRYVEARPYLIGIICSCSTRKVGETPLQPGGRFDFCYSVPLVFIIAGTICRRSFAFRVRQRIQGSWVTVYDGLAAHDWHDQGEFADLRTSDWRALVCGSGPGDPPPTDDELPFVMLEYVGSQSTHHFNFPAQTALSSTAPLLADSGTYTTGYAPDCPWGGTLPLRLWVHPDMEPIAHYYRFSVVPANANGTPNGTPTILDATVTWSRFVFVGGDWVTTPETLTANPADVGGQQGLNRIPYWSGGNHWLSSQSHQVWNTAAFAPGRWLLLLELFDATGARIKPASAPGSDPGTARPFQLRRWRFADPTATDNVPFGDAAHVFRTDNTVVQGDIVDFRRAGIPNPAECQFISGPADTPISVGFRAYHTEGVSNPTNTFMRQYTLRWYRGLNGPTGLFAAGSADVGEPPSGPHPSGSLTIGQLLGPWPPSHPAHNACTFSVRLHVEAKHFNGSSRIQSYDYHETASFALSLVP